jgi:hypothetical protein
VHYRAEDQERVAFFEGWGYYQRGVWGGGRDVDLAMRIQVRFLEIIGHNRQRDIRRERKAQVP